MQVGSCIPLPVSLALPCPTRGSFPAPLIVPSPAIRGTCVWVLELCREARSSQLVLAGCPPGAQDHSEEQVIEEADRRSSNGRLHLFLLRNGGSRSQGRGGSEIHPSWLQIHLSWEWCGVEGMPSRSAGSLGHSLGSALSQLLTALNFTGPSHSKQT
ncbi:Condensin Complex Subunit 1 [Manis pentadactyla]|nr:Condensin Complex Subunit 1 [Manis pentadactyla]